MQIDCSKLLEQTKLKKTIARLAVLEYLKTQNQPSSVERIYQSIQGKENSIDLATVYRTINTFLEKKLVKEVNFQEGKLRYELSGHHHHHLVCQNCGNIIPIYDCHLEEQEKKIEKKHHFFINYHSLEFFGICQKCKQL